MPLITIEYFEPADPTQITKILTDIRDSGAEALGSSKNNIWVMFRPLSRAHYLQGDSPSDLRSPILNIRAQTGRTPSERKALTNAVATAAARGLSVPTERIWVHYQEMRPEDVWFEGHFTAE